MCSCKLLQDLEDKALVGFFQVVDGAAEHVAGETDHDAGIVWA